MGSLLDGVARMVCSGSRVYFDFMDAAALTGRAHFPGFRVTSKVRVRGTTMAGRTPSAGGCLSTAVYRSTSRLLRQAEC